MVSAPRKSCLIATSSVKRPNENATEHLSTGREMPPIIRAVRDRTGPFERRRWIKGFPNNSQRLAAGACTQFPAPGRDTNRKDVRGRFGRGAKASATGSRNHEGQDRI